MIVLHCHVEGYCPIRRIGSSQMTATRTKSAGKSQPLPPRRRSAGAGPVLQPRAVLAAVQPARAGGGAKQEPSAARAAAVSLDLRLEPRRILHGARRRPVRPGRGRRHDAVAGRADAGAAARRDQPVRRAASSPTSRPAGASSRRSSPPTGIHVVEPDGADAARARLARTALHDAHLPDPDADRRRSGASRSRSSSTRG